MRFTKLRIVTIPSFVHTMWLLLSVDSDNRMVCTRFYEMEATLTLLCGCDNRYAKNVKFITAFLFVECDIKSFRTYESYLQLAV
jgi:hypothetical protein